MITGNKRPSLPPTDALDLICKICQSEYNKGKRKININRIWNIAEAGLPDNYTGETTTPKQSVFSDNRSDDSTATRFSNSGPIEVIG